MKKMFTTLVMGLGLLFSGWKMGLADLGPAPVPINWPSSAQTQFLNGQVILTIINHGTFSEEYRSGQKQMVLSDNIIEAGHLNSQYLLALDGSVYQKPSETNLDGELGIRLNFHSLVNRFITFTPQW